MTDSTSIPPVAIPMAGPQNLLDVIAHVDDVSAANHAANFVMLGAVLSLMVERLGISLDDVEEKVSEILRASAEGAHLSSPACAARCALFLSVLRQSPSSPSTARN
jgi:hypothetical protein